MQRADTSDVQRLIEKGAQIVEVLPRSDYERAHLPGAVNVPLASMQPDALTDLDPRRPTVTYCYDYQCDLSARAARRLELLGFVDVYDFVASKMAWMGCGLPVEGTEPASAQAGAIARRDVPRCVPGERVADVRTRFDDRGICVVVDGDESIVVGVVRQEVAALPSATPIEDVLQPAPPTVRPSIAADDLARSMDEDGRDYVLVTTLEGTLIGTILRSDLHGHH
jgi:rhodanese-related sulfurtransferase